MLLEAPVKAERFKKKKEKSLKKEKKPSLCLWRPLVSPEGVGMSVLVPLPRQEPILTSSLHYVCVYVDAVSWKCPK